MLIFADRRTGRASTIEGAAHIVISIDAAGKASLRAMCHDASDCFYPAMTDDRLRDVVPGLVAELRAQLAAGSS